MAGQGLAALQEQYASHLATLYRQLAGQVVVETACRQTEHGQALAAALQGESVAAIVHRMLGNLSEIAPSNSIADLRTRAALLQQLGNEAKQGLEQELLHITKCVKTHADWQALLAQHAESGSYQDPALNAALSQFMSDVQNRVNIWIDQLAESRFDADVYKRMLLTEVLDLANLAQVMSSAAEVGYKQQKERWKHACAELGLELGAEPARTPFDIAALAEVFLLPVQLQYERPNVLKSIALALSRGKFREKLTSEITAGLEQMRPRVVAAIDNAWQEAERQWLAIAQAAVDTWLYKATGSDRAGCLARQAQLEEKIATIVAWLADLHQVVPQQTLKAWTPKVQGEACNHLAQRMVQETQRRTTG